MAVCNQMRRWASILGCVAVAMLLTGCFRYDHRVKIDEDGGGSIQITAVFDPEIAFEELSGQRVIFNRSPGYNRDQVCEAIQPPEDFDLGIDDGTIIPYEKNDFCGFRAETVLEPSVDHSEALESLFEPGSTLVKNGDGWEFMAILDQAVFTDMVETVSYTHLTLPTILRV